MPGPSKPLHESLENKTILDNVDDFSNIDVLMSVNTLEDNLAEVVIADEDKPTSIFDFLNSIHGLMAFIPLFSMAFKLGFATRKFIYWISHAVTGKSYSMFTPSLKMGFIVTGTVLILLALMFPAFALALGIAAAALTVIENFWDIYQAFTSRFAVIKRFFNHTGILNQEKQGVLNNKKKLWKLLESNKAIIEEFIDKNKAINELKEEIGEGQESLKKVHAGLEFFRNEKSNKKELLIKNECLNDFRNKNKILNELESNYNDTVIFHNGIRKNQVDFINLVQKTNSLLVGIVVLVGAALLITPLAPVGALILGITFVYGLVSGLSLFAVAKSFGKVQQPNFCKYLEIEINALEKSAEDPASDLSSSFTNIQESMKDFSTIGSMTSEKTCKTDQSTGKKTKELKTKTTKKDLQDKIKLGAAETQQKAPKSFFVLPEPKSTPSGDASVLRVWSNARNGF